MNIRKKISGVVVAGWLFSSAFPATAALLTYEFSGVVDFVHPSMEGTFSSSQFSGSYTVDTAVPGANTGFFGATNSLFYPALTALNVRSGGYLGSMVPSITTLAGNGISVARQLTLITFDAFKITDQDPTAFTVDSYAVRSAVSPSAGSYSGQTTLSLSFLDRAASTLSSLDLAVPPSQLLAFPENSFSLTYLDTSTITPIGSLSTPILLVSGRITSMSATPVPIPGALLLLVSGMAALIPLCHRKH